MNRTLSHPRRTTTAVVAFFVALVGVSALAAPAWAHGGPGKLVVVSTEPQADGTSVKVTVQLNFAEDGDPAADATVTVVGELQGGGSSPAFTPVTLTAAGPEGQYAGVVPIPGPGTWNLRVTSVEPPATATTQVSTAATSRTDGSSAATATTATPTSSTTTTVPAGTKDDEGSNLLVKVVPVAVVAGALAALVVGLRRRSAAGSSGTGSSGDDQG